MIAIAISGVVLAALAGLVVGVRLLLVSRRTREFPEALLGAVLLLSVFAANVLHAVATAGGLDPQGGVIPVRAAAMLCANLGAALLILFTSRVLRPDARWARFASGLALVFAPSAVVGELAVGSLATPLVDGSWGWGGYAMRLTAFGWGTFEVVREYAKLVRQQRLGLVEPLITHRILLWSIAAAAATAIALASGVSSLLDPTGQRIAVAAYAMGSLGFAAAVCVSLSFFPPQRYQRWIEARAALASVA